jgi:hypothetical protein
MFNKIKSIQLEPVEFLWKILLTGVICVPVPILGLGMLGWYLSMRFGLLGLSASLLVAFMALIGTGIGFWLSMVVIAIGKKGGK